MKVLFGYLTYQYRGGSKFQLDFAGHFQNSQVGFLTSNEKICYEDDARKIGPIHRIPPTKQFFRRLNAMKALAKEYDVLYLNKAVLNPFELYLVKKSGFKKVVFHSHATNKDCKNYIVKMIYNFLHVISRPFIDCVADKKCACSIPAAEWLFGKKRLHKVDIITNGIDLGRFSFSELLREKKREELQIDGFCVMHVGSFSAVKNQGYLVDAFFDFNKKHSNSMLLFVGDGENLVPIQQKVKSLGLESAIRFLGHRNDVNEIMQAADLFVLPSKIEGFPFVAVEAQASGLPCIITSSATSEAKILSSCDFFDVSLPSNELSLLMEEKMDELRENSSELLFQKGFDLKDCAQRLESDLENMCR